MHSLKIFTCIFAYQLALVAPIQETVHAFWLTDGTLFANQVQPVAKSEPGSVSQQPQNINRVASYDTPIGRNTSGDLIGKTQGESWTQLSDLSVSSRPATKSQQTSSSQANPEPAKASQVPCQCNAEWLQGQTNLWLNKWLSSASFVQHLQHSIFRLSNSSALTGRSVAWSRPSKRHSNNIGGSADTKVQHSGHQAKSATPANSQQQAISSRPVKVVRGEQGPKGDRGPAGERGPSGLISVTDRDALFDLSPVVGAVMSESKKNDASNQVSSGPTGDETKRERRLAFVESEQLLVVETPIGWRPVQMMAPLRDFRKTIAKFSLSPADAKRLRLLDDCATKQLVTGKPALARDCPAGGKRLRGLQMDSLDALDEGADEDDELDDEDEDDNNGRDDKFEDESEDEADEEEEEDDDDDKDLAMKSSVDSDRDDRSMNSIARPLADSRAGWPLKSVADLSGSSRPKQRRVQVSGRSAVAPASVIETNMIAAEAAADPVEPELPLRPRDSQPDVMRLRLVALDEPFAGNQHGLRGANFECKRHASRANIKGAFRAFLGTNYQNLNEIVRYSASHVQKYPIVNSRGEVLANSWHDLFKSPARMTNPLSRIYSFDGRHVSSDPNWPNKLVWHGAGSKLGGRDSAHNCDSWHSDSLNKFGFATPIHPPRGHSYHQKQVSKEKRHQLRQADEPGNQADRGGSNNSTALREQPLVFDVIDKFPCRMPLIVLCIETVAQSGE